METAGQISTIQAQADAIAAFATWLCPLTPEAFDGGL